MSPAEQLVFAQGFAELLLNAGVATTIERDGHLQNLRAVMAARGYTRPSIAQLRRLFADAVARRSDAGFGDDASHPSHPSPGGDWGAFDPPPPVPSGVAPPPGWAVLPHGVFQVAGRSSAAGEPVVPAPLVVTGRHISVEEGYESLELCWLRDGEWRRRVVPRDVLASKVKIVELAAYGLPVTSETSSRVVKYLADFEAANLDRLPRVAVSHSLGWAPDMHSFLWGETLLRAAGPAAPAGGTLVRFQGADAGDDQVARGFRFGGTAEGWRGAVGPELAAPKLRLAVTFSLATPLLVILGAPNPIYELCGETSRGKTVALRVAASVWGCPDERSPDAVMGTWDTTRVGAERTLAVVNNLPLFLDDTRRAKNAELVSALVYDVASGRGRKRGTPKGVQRSGTWSTALLSSGESSVNDLAEKGGAKARVLSVWGSPFGEASGAMGVRVKALNCAVLTHFGHAGPEFVQHLLDRRDAWPGWVARYEELTGYYARRAGDNPVLGRMADTFAMLGVVGEVAAEALALPALASPPVHVLWGELAGAVVAGDVPARAVRHVHDWALSRQNRFYVSSPAGNPVPAAGWAGKWDYNNAEWTAIEFFPNELNEILRAGEFEPQPVVRSWKERGWLRLAADGGNPCQRVGTSRSRLVTILRAALEEPAGADPSASDPRPVSPARYAP